MTSDPILISPVTRAVLLELAGSTGRPPAELLATAVEEFRQRLAAAIPITSIPGVNPADVWEAAAQADAGQLTSFEEVFAKLRARP